MRAQAGIYLPVSMRTLLLTIGMSYGGFDRCVQVYGCVKRQGGYVTLEILHGGKKIVLPALRDTETHRDPVTAMPVPIIEEASASKLFEKELSDVLFASRGKSASERMELLWEYDPGLRFRLIPYSAVGVKSDMLLAFKPDCVRLGGREMKGMWIALSPTRVSDNGTYSALVCADTA